MKKEVNLQGVNQLAKTPGSKIPLVYDTTKE